MQANAPFLRLSRHHAAADAPRIAAAVRACGTLAASGTLPAFSLLFSSLLLDLPTGCRA